MERRRYRGGVGLPILLVGLGLVLLLNNLHVTDLGLWDMIVRGWPVLFLAAGLDLLVQRRGVAAPALLIGLGTALLLNNAGLWAWDAWGVLWRFWPLLLVAAGIDLVIGGRSSLGSVRGKSAARFSAFGLLWLLALLAVGAWVLGPKVAGEGSFATERIAQSADGARQAHIVIEPAVADLRIGALSASSRLVEGALSTRSDLRVVSTYAVNDGTGTFTLKTVGAAVIPGFAGVPSHSTWELELNRDLPIALEVSLGAGSADLDLTDINVTDLRVNVGAGKATVVLPRQGHLVGSIRGAVGEIVIVIPKGVAARIRANAGLGSVEAPREIAAREGTYITPGYDSAEGRVELDVTQALGSVTIRYSAE